MNKGGAGSLSSSRISFMSQTLALREVSSIKVIPELFANSRACHPAYLLPATRISAVWSDCAYLHVYCLPSLAMAPRAKVTLRCSPLSPRRWGLGSGDLQALSCRCGQPCRGKKAELHTVAMNQTCWVSQEEHLDAGDRSGEEQGLNLWSSGTHQLIQGPETEVHLLVRKGSGSRGQHRQRLESATQSKPAVGLLRCSEHPGRPKASRAGVVWGQERTDHRGLSLPHPQA